MGCDVQLVSFISCYNFRFHSEKVEAFEQSVNLLRYLISRMLLIFYYFFAKCIKCSE